MSLMKNTVTISPTLLHYATTSYRQRTLFEQTAHPCSSDNSPIRSIGQEPLFYALLVRLAIGLSLRRNLVSLHFNQRRSSVGLLLGVWNFDEYLSRILFVM